MINDELNIILKKMWSIKNQIDNGEVPLQDDSEYWNENIKYIVKYYTDNAYMWTKLLVILQHRIER